MYKKILLLVAVCLLPTSIFAANTEFAQSIQIDHAKEFDHYLLGGSITINTLLNGDLVAAGGIINLEHGVREDVIVAWESVRVMWGVGDDARIAGKHVLIDSEIQDHLFVAGGMVELTNNTLVKNDAYIIGWEISVDGTYEENVEIFGDNVVIKGIFKGNVLVGSHTINRDNDAKIMGNLTLRSTEKPTNIEDIVQGEFTFEQMDKAYNPNAFHERPQLFNRRFFLTTLILSGLCITFMPTYLTTATKKIIKKPGTMFLYGLLLYIVSPIIIALIGATVVGLPIAWLLLAMYIFTLVLFPVRTTMFGAQMIFNKRFNKQKKPLLIKYGIVVVLSLIVTIVPLWITFIISCFAAGAGRVQDLSILKKSIK